MDSRTNWCCCCRSFKRKETPCRSSRLLKRLVSGEAVRCGRRRKGAAFFLNCANSHPSQSRFSPLTKVKTKHIQLFGVVDSLLSNQPNIRGEGVEMVTFSERTRGTISQPLCKEEQRTKAKLERCSLCKRNQLSFHVGDDRYCEMQLDKEDRKGWLTER